MKKLILLILMSLCLIAPATAQHRNRSYHEGYCKDKFYNCHDNRRDDRYEDERYRRNRHWSSRPTHRDCLFQYYTYRNGHRVAMYYCF